MLTPFISHGRDPLALSAARSSRKMWTSELFWVKAIQVGLTELPGSGGALPLRNSVQMRVALTTAGS